MWWKQWAPSSKVRPQEPLHTFTILWEICNCFVNKCILAHWKMENHVEKGRGTTSRSRAAGWPSADGRQIGKPLKPELSSWSINPWATVICGYFKSCGLGKFVIHHWIPDTVRNTRSYLRKLSSHQLLLLAHQTWLLLVLHSFLWTLSW